MPNETLWKDDRPPTKGELKHYLVHVLGIPDEDAEGLVAAYSEDPGGITDKGTEWTQESLSEYVDDLVEKWRTDNDVSESEFSSQQAQAQVEAEKRKDEQRDAEGQQAADAARAAVAEVRRSTYSRARARWVTDIDSQFDISQSMASGVMVDGNGNPVVDPNTGEQIPADSATVFQAIRHARFDMGALSYDFQGSVEQQRSTQAISDRSLFEERKRDQENMDQANRVAQATGRRLGVLPSDQRAAQYMTPSQVLRLLANMDEDDLTSLQQKMLDAGLYSMVSSDGEQALPDWGNADPLTRRAFMQLFVEASQRSGESIDKVLADLTDNNLVRNADGPGGPGGTGGPGQLTVDIPAFEPTVMSKETLGAMVDDLAQDMLGQYVDDDTKASLVEKMQQRELALQRRAYDQSVADIRGQARQEYGAATGGAGGGQIDAFMAAIASTESGGDYTASNDVGPGHYGKYQISNTNWPTWAERAGLGRDAPKTPENQERVARTIMLDYYARFGNWRDVAIAWFAGPGAVGRAGAESRSDGNMTVREYADRAVSRMSQFTGGAPGAGLVETGGAIHDPIEQFDPQAELQAALKAKDPLGYQGHEFAGRAVEFFSLLGGLV